MSTVTVLVRLAAVLFIGLLVVFRLPASSAQRALPNVVVIVTDDQNVDSLPVMRKLASSPQGSWVRFTNAFVNDSICCPARASLLTGQYAFRTGVVDNRTGDRLKDANTLPVWLDRAGYRTGLIGKYLNGYPWDKGDGYVPPGWDSFRQSSSGGADERTRLAVDFVEDRSAAPFFLYLAYNDPHWAARPAPRYASAEVYVPRAPRNLNEADVSDKPRWIRKLPLLDEPTIEEWRRERVASQRALLAVDDGIQRIVAALKAKRQLGNTMIVFIADHGFSWGSHRWIKKVCVYEECIRTPLFVRYPGLQRNRIERRLVSNVDVATTIADYVGIRPRLPQDGRSLLPLITDTAKGWSEEIFLEAHQRPSRTFDGIRVRGWVYAEYANGDKELYDLANDPFQLQNQASNPAYRAKREELARRMRGLRGT